MRYLKKYKFFESKEEIDDNISVLNDMVLDIKDKDLNVEVKLRRIYGTNPDKFPVLDIFIFKDDTSGNDRFTSDEIIHEITQITEFMKSEGWGINLKVSTPYGSYDSKIEDGKIYSKDNMTRRNIANFWITRIHIVFFQV
jgi:hypothetical protein